MDTKSFIIERGFQVNKVFTLYFYHLICHFYRRKSIKHDYLVSLGLSTTFWSYLLYIGTGPEVFTGLGFSVCLHSPCSGNPKGLRCLDPKVSFIRLLEYHFYLLLFTIGTLERHIPD